MLDRLAAAFGKSEALRVIWLSDGIDDGNMRLSKYAHFRVDDFELTLRFLDFQMRFVLPGQHDIADAALDKCSRGAACAGVQHRDVKNGFECAHVPSIDLSTVPGAGGEAPRASRRPSPA